MIRALRFGGRNEIGTGSELAVAESDNGCGVLAQAPAAETAGFSAQASAAKLETPENTEDFGEILHGLNNVLVSILLNAQFMEWKLPSYSRMRRNTHEIQRSAQRAGVLLKRLASRPGAPQK